MEITPFHDYSNALLPLPPLNGPGSPFPSTQADRTSPFRDEIAKALGPDVSQAGYSAAISSPDSTLSAGSAVSSSLENSGTDPLMDVCRQLEGFLLSLLLRDMGKSFAGSTLFSQTYESSVYRDMFLTEVGRSIGERPPGLGIADAVYRDTILKESEAALNEPQANGSGRI